MFIVELYFRKLYLFRTNRFTIYSHYIIIFSLLNLLHLSYIFFTYHLIKKILILICLSFNYLCALNELNYNNNFKNDIKNLSTIIHNYISNINIFLEMWKWKSKKESIGYDYNNKIKMKMCCQNKTT